MEKDRVSETSTKVPSISEDVLPQIINIFVLWVIKNALERDIKRLYFLARDMYAAYILAQEYCAKLNLKIECRYLYCSRYSLRLPMYSENTLEAINYICGNGININLKQIFARAGMNENEAKEFIQQLDIKLDLNKVLTKYELYKLKDTLHNSEDFITVMNHKSKEQWENLFGYFKQEGMFEEKRIAIVDSGWIGATQKNINSIRKRAGCEAEVEGFYFGLYEIPMGCDKRKYHTFYFSPIKHFLRKVFFCNCFLEIIYGASHGTTIGYEKSEDKYLPRLREQTVTNRLKTTYILDKALQCVRKNTINKTVILKMDYNKKISELSYMLMRFMCCPSKEEVDYYGSLLFSDDLLDNGLQELAPCMTAKELLSNHVLWRMYAIWKNDDCEIRGSAWLEGSAVRHGDRFYFYRIGFYIYKILLYIKNLKKY